MTRVTNGSPKREERRSKVEIEILDGLGANCDYLFMNFIEGNAVIMEQSNMNTQFYILKFTEYECLRVQL